MKTRKVKAGDRFVGWFRSPWDSDVPIKVTFIVRKEWCGYKGLWCEGIETNEFDGWFDSFRNLEAVKP